MIAINEWKLESLVLVHAVCLQQEDFTVDDLWDAGMARPGKGDTVSGLLRTARGKDICELGDRVSVSREPRRKGATVRVWKSLIYKQAKRKP